MKKSLAIISVHVTFESIVIMVLKIYLIYIAIDINVIQSKYFTKNVFKNQLHLQTAIFISNHLYTFPPLDRN